MDRIHRWVWHSVTQAVLTHSQKAACCQILTTNTNIIVIFKVCWSFVFVCYVLQHVSVRATATVKPLKMVQNVAAHLVLKICSCHSPLALFRCSRQVQVKLRQALFLELSTELFLSKFVIYLDLTLFVHLPNE